MKIAFVGKGGSGKTTMSVLFSQYASIEHKVLTIDADINMHTASELGVNTDEIKILSDKETSLEIRRLLIGDNKRIESVSHFRKSTPPARGSKLIDITNNDDVFIEKYTKQINQNLHLGVVGTYSESGISSSCYHNNLAIAENILSHTKNNQGILCADMVAGTDAFASTLYAQFDLIVLVVEPTKRSVEIFNQYLKLAKSAKVDHLLKVVANKIEDDDDIDFVKSFVGDKLIASFEKSKHLKRVDKGVEKILYQKLETSSQQSLANIMDCLKTYSNKNNDAERLERLWSAHRIYAGQDYVVRAVGDLSSQIDENFKYE